MAGRDGSEIVSVRWYRRCLRLLPRSFRREAGPEMEAVFRDGRRSALRRGLRAYTLFAISVLVDLCITAVAEWWRVLVGRVRRNASRPQRPEFGDAERYREEGMAARVLRHLDELRRNVRYLMRTLPFRDQAFSLTVLLTLGVCIGANVAIYSVIETVILSPLPFDEPDRLVTMYNLYPNLGVGREQAGNGSPDFFLRRERVAGLDEVAALRGSVSAVGRAGRTESVSSLRVTPSLFPMLGVDPVLGRTFLEEEMDVSGERTVILSHGYWEERFGGSPGTYWARVYKSTASPLRSSACSARISGSP